MNIIHETLQVSTILWFTYYSLSFFINLFLSSCSKTAYSTKDELHENISRQELILWINKHHKLIPNGTKPLLDQTVKTYVDGQMVLKMPLSSVGDHFNFAKKDKLEVHFLE